MRLMRHIFTSSVCRIYFVPMAHRLFQLGIVAPLTLDFPLGGLKFALRFDDRLRHFQQLVGRVPAPFTHPLHQSFVKKPDPHVPAGFQTKKKKKGDPIQIKSGAA